MAAILIQANAKLNLDLEILGKRPDGYHQIKSTFQSIDLSDFLLFKKPSTRAELGAGLVPHRNEVSGAGSENDHFTGGIICPSAQNIILKAKKILEKALKKKLSCEIHLQKTIPIAAGLGGGSADAAATLQGLNLLYNLKLSKVELVKNGIKAGADVPFFFYGGTCQVEGIGEKVTPVKQKLPKFFLVFRPHKRLETKKMYELYDKTGKNFLALAREICPEIEKLENYLNDFRLKPKLSGSGPTLFCGVNNYKLAKEITEGYQDFNGDIFICRPEKTALKTIEI